MKLTAIDVTHTKFNRSLRGYKQSEVDDLLKRVADELELAATERARYEQQIEMLHAEIARYKEMEETLNNSILLAQKTADEVRTSARREADIVIREAELLVAKKTSDAIHERQETLNEIRRLVQKRDVFMDSLRSANRDLADWLEHRRWEEVITMSSSDFEADEAPEAAQIEIQEPVSSMLEEGPQKVAG